MEPLVSILMPNYNGERFVGETIKSVLSQTYKNFEFIIVDDCSTDGSRNIIDSFDDDRLVKVYKEKNEQVCRALNDGLLAVKGKYIARIDSDDCWKPDKLLKQIQFLEEHEEYIASFSGVTTVNEFSETIDGDIFNTIFNQKNRTRSEWIRRLFFEGNCLCHTSAVIRTDFIKQYGGYRNVFLQLQDYEMWLRILLHGNIYMHEEPLVIYRRVQKGNTSLSARSEFNDTRCYNEKAYLLSTYLDNMSDELFKNCFGNQFKNENAASHDELECEKAFIMLGIRADAGRESGLLKLSALIDNDNTRKILEEKYAFGCLDFYRLNREHYFLDDIIKKSNNTILDAVVTAYYEDESGAVGQVKKLVSIKGGKLECSFNIPSEAKSLRIDPVDDMSCMVSDFTAASAGNELLCKPINGDIYDYMWVFETRDPQINIELTEDFNGELTICCNIFVTGSEVFDAFSKGVRSELDEKECLINELKQLIYESDLEKEALRMKVLALEQKTENLLNQIEAKDNHINNREAEIESLKELNERAILDKDRHIENLENVISAREAYINEIENTKVWKLYRKVKKN